MAAKLVYFGQTIDPIILEPFARRFDELVLWTFLKILAIDQISEDQKLQIQLALRDGGCGVRAHDVKELQRLYVASALLVAPAVHAATGEHGFSAFLFGSLASVIRGKPEKRVRRRNRKTPKFPSGSVI